MKKIAVLTSGGDSSGMNSCIKYLFDECEKNGLKLVGVLRGYEGLMKGDFVNLSKSQVEQNFNRGGSFIKTSRSEFFKTEQGKVLAVESLKKNNIDYLIVVGGNGSLNGAKSLANYFSNIIFIPATIDNDVSYTDNTIGFDTAVSNAQNAIDIMMDSMRSNDRGFVVEVMGRKCADIAHLVGKITKASLIIDSQCSFEDILEKLKNKHLDNSPLIIVRENLLDVNLLAQFLSQKFNKTFKSTVLGYIQRGGKPTSAEKLLTKKFSKKAVAQIMLDKKGVAIGIKSNRLIVEKFSNLN